LARETPVADYIADGSHDRVKEIRNGDRWLKDHLDAYR
jgi:hypothetical protein